MNGMISFVENHYQDTNTTVSVVMLNTKIYALEVAEDRLTGKRIRPLGDCKTSIDTLMPIRPCLALYNLCSLYGLQTPVQHRLIFTDLSDPG